MLAGRAEAVAEIAPRQCGDGAEGRQAETGEQAGELGVDLTGLVQPGDGLRGEEATRGTGGDDERS